MNSSLRIRGRISGISNSGNTYSGLIPHSGIFCQGAIENRLGFQSEIEDLHSKGCIMEENLENTIIGSIVAS
jgi:hypothetical protein